MFHQTCLAIFLFIRFEPQRSRAGRTYAADNRMDRESSHVKNASPRPVPEGLYTIARSTGFPEERVQILGRGLGDDAGNCLKVVEQVRGPILSSFAIMASSTMQGRLVVLTRPAINLCRSVASDDPALCRLPRHAPRDRRVFSVR
jgi:hypothetical protein